MISEYSPKQPPRPPLGIDCYFIKFLKITEMSNYRSGHPKVAASINPQQSYFSDKRETGVLEKIPAQF